MQNDLNSPRVTVLTPVYNGGRFLRECIESVLAQDYQNWEYIIVNNRSTDDTLEIAQSYAARDPRIRVTTNKDFLSMPENFNNAFGMVPPDSKYFKVVCADDWILPQCLSKMVRFAEQRPSVGVVSCYQQSGSEVRWAELSPMITVLTGREACRKALLEGVKLFGAPTAFLYRSDLLRMGKPFFPNLRPHSDTSACYQALQHCDLGIVHELLSVERVHGGQITSKVERMANGTVAYVEVLLEYGPIYLTEQELIARKKEVFDQYYRFLGGCFLKMRGQEFWNFQRTRLNELGCELQWRYVAAGAMSETFEEIRNPRVAFGKLVQSIQERIRGNS